MADGEQRDRGESDVSDEEDKLLENTWTWYYVEKSASVSLKQEEYNKLLKPLGSFNTIKTFWEFWSDIMESKNFSESSTLFLFKQGVRPLWEDQENVQGGKYSVTLQKAISNQIWSDLVLSCIGGHLDSEEQPQVTGIVHATRPRGNIVSVWVSHVPDESHSFKQHVETVGTSFREILEGTGVPGIKDRVEFYRHGDNIAHNAELRQKKKDNKDRSVDSSLSRSFDAGSQGCERRLSSDAGSTASSSGRRDRSLSDCKGDWRSHDGSDDEDWTSVSSRAKRESRRFDKQSLLRGRGPRSNTVSPSFGPMAAPTRRLARSAAASPATSPALRSMSTASSPGTKASSKIDSNSSPSTARAAWGSPKVEKTYGTSSKSSPTGSDKPKPSPKHRPKESPSLLAKEYTHSKIVSNEGSPSLSTSSDGGVMDMPKFPAHDDESKLSPDGPSAQKKLQLSVRDPDVAKQLPTIPGTPTTGVSGSGGAWNNVEAGGQVASISWTNDGPSAAKPKTAAQHALKAKESRFTVASGGGVTWTPSSSAPSSLPPTVEEHPEPPLPTDPPPPSQDAKPPTGKQQASGTTKKGPSPKPSPKASPRSSPGISPVKPSFRSPTKSPIKSPAASPGLGAMNLTPPIKCSNWADACTTPELTPTMTSASDSPGALSSSSPAPNVWENGKEKSPKDPVTGKRVRAWKHQTSQSPSEDKGPSVAKDESLKDKKPPSETNAWAAREASKKQAAAKESKAEGKENVAKAKEDKAEAKEKKTDAKDKKAEAKVKKPEAKENKAEAKEGKAGAKENKVEGKGDSPPKEGVKNGLLASPKLAVKPQGTGLLGEKPADRVPRMESAMKTPSNSGSSVGSLSAKSSPKDGPVPVGKSWASLAAAGPDGATSPNPASPKEESEAERKEREEREKAEAIQKDRVMKLRAARVEKEAKEKEEKEKRKREKAQKAKEAKLEKAEESKEGEEASKKAAAEKENAGKASEQVAAEADEHAKTAADAKAAKEAEAKAKKEQDAKAKAAKDAEAKAKKEQDAKAKAAKDAEDKARKEEENAAEKAKKEADAKAAKEKKEKAEAEAKAKKEADANAKREAEAAAAKKEEERAAAEKESKEKKAKEVKERQEREAKEREEKQREEERQDKERAKQEKAKLRGEGDGWQLAGGEESEDAMKRQAEAAGSAKRKAKASASSQSASQGVEEKEDREEEEQEETVGAAQQDASQGSGTGAKGGPARESSGKAAAKKGSGKKGKAGGGKIFTDKNATHHMEQRPLVLRLLKQHQTIIVAVTALIVGAFLNRIMG